MPRTNTATILAAACALSLSAAQADDILDALDATRSAYEAGNVGAALQELSIAQALMQQQKTASFVSFLPEAPDGWSRELDNDVAAGLAMFGGGTGAEATYSNGTDRVSLMLLADSPMVASMAGMLNNPAVLMASGGKLVKVGDQRFAQTDSEYTGMVANRILIQASGQNEAAVITILEQVDYNGLAGYAP